MILFTNSYITSWIGVGPVVPPSNIESVRQYLHYKTPHDNLAPFSDKSHSTSEMCAKW